MTTTTNHSIHKLIQDAVGEPLMPVIANDFEFFTMDMKILISFDTTWEEAHVKKFGKSNNDAITFAEVVCRVDNLRNTISALKTINY